MKRSIAMVLFALLVSAPALAGGFGAGDGATAPGGIGSVPDLGLGSVAAVQQYHGQAAQAVTERDCQARHRSFRSRTTLRPSERKRQLAACLDLVARAPDRVDIAQRGN